VSTPNVGKRTQTVPRLLLWLFFPLSLLSLLLFSFAVSFISVFEGKQNEKHHYLLHAPKEKEKERKYYSFLFLNSIRISVLS
jgi:hypothetical protein